MRRAGDMDRQITIQQIARTTNEFGASVETSSDIMTLRAKKIDGTAADVMHNGIAISDTTLVFQTYWQDGITLENRICFDSIVYTIKKIREIGRRDGMELHVERFGV